MNYIELIIETENEELQELLISQLNEIGFTGFEQEKNQLKSIIFEADFNEKEVVELTAAHQLKYSKKIIPHQNWNALWESNFEPIAVDDFVGVRAAFHLPIKNVQHEIIITPKMSFGTGHHATTFLVMQLMQHIDFKNKTVFDFGTGTGILAILAEKLGAKNIVAIDYDDWCIENANENIIQNNCSRIEIVQADHVSIEQSFDIVIANINKNIIQDNFENLYHAAAKNAVVLLSGLLITDEKDILHLAQEKQLNHITTVVKGDWIAMQFIRI